MFKLFNHLSSKDGPILRRPRFDAVVVSYGGVGTTFFVEFLRDRLRVNSHNSFDDGIKHANSPNHPVFKGKRVRRAIYVYGNPIQAVMSHFRRDYHKYMIPKLTSDSHTGSADYTELVRASPVDITFDQFLEEGKDQFGLAEHWRRWTREPLAFDTLFVRFEVFFENLEAIFDFLELPRSDLAHFPAKKERKTALLQLDPAKRAAMDTIYGDLVRDMDARPGLFIRRAEEG